MKRKYLLLIAAVLVVWAMFSLITLTGYAPKGPVFYVSYTFISLAFAVQILVPVLTGTEKSEGLKVLGIPLLISDFIYLVIAFVLGIAFMYLGFIDLRMAILVQGLVAGIYLALLLVLLAGKEQIREDMDSVPDQTKSMRNMASRAECLYNSQQDYQKKMALKKLYEALRYANPVSRTAYVEDRDAEISDRISYLEMNSDSISLDELKETVDSTVELVKKRNM